METHPSNEWKFKTFVKKKIRVVDISTTQVKEKEQDHTDTDIELIKQKSAKEASLKEIDPTYINESLIQTLVKSNGFQIIPVKADGNCLVETTPIQVIEMNVVEMQRLLSLTYETRYISILKKTVITIVRLQNVIFGNP